METYEKKYKEAQKWIESIYTELSHERQMEVEAFFPEIFENEDERIREMLIKFFSKGAKNNCYTESIADKDIIAWLEKQGDKDKLIKELGEYKVKYTQEVLESYINSMSIKEKAHQIAWETSKHYDPNACKQEWCEMAAIDMADYLKKQSEQKPTNKAEPRFKVGVWVLWDNKICCHIDDIHRGEKYLVYTITDTNNMIRSYAVECFEKNARLWTIQDAKDGDVLVSAEVIFIFNKVHSVWINCHCSLHKDESFIDEDYDLMHIKYSKEVCPATKEQRNILFKKMKEAGYEWNAKKKELKKIEQKSVEESNGNNGKTSSNWSKEDEYRTERLLGWLDTLINYIHHDAIVSLDLRRERIQQVEQVKTWLKSLKEKLIKTEGGEV